MTTSGRIRVGILGPLLVLRDDVELDVGGPKQRALLIDLALRAGQPVPAERLVDDLWGDSPPKQVAASLHAYISNLRKALGTTGNSTSVLPRRVGGYQLDIDPSAVDAVRFGEGVGAGRHAAAAGDFELARKELDAALSLWRGDALADVADEAFAAPEIARLDELRLLAREEHAAAALELGDHAGVTPDLDALVGLHPLRERLRALLVMALYRSGRQADALARCREGRAVLADELGIDPGPELSELENRVLRQDPTLDMPIRPAEAIRIPVTPTSARGDASPDAGGVSATSTAPSVGPAPSAQPLVGRDDELERLRSFWSLTSAGRGRIVLISGEAGIGKSRLVDELSRDVAALGGDVRWGRCFETEGTPVFWPWVQVIRSVIADMGDHTLRSLIATLPSELTMLVPELGEQPRADPPILTDQPLDARFRLLDGVTRLLLGAAASRPRLIVLEDAHWADEASLDVLRMLAQYVAAAPVMVVVTHRDAVTQRGRALSAAIAPLARETAVDLMSVARLTTADLASLCHAMTGHVPSDAMVKDLEERSDGNPLFATQLLTQVDADCMIGSEVPTGLRELLQQRVTDLPRDTRDALEVASVEGRDTTLAVLASVLGRPVADALDLLDPAAAAGLIAPLPDGSRYRFAHVLLRDALYEALPPGRRVRLHAAVGEALEDDVTRVTEMAHHFEHAAVIGYAGRAHDAAMRAADAAERVYAFADAEGHLRHALRLVDGKMSREVRVQSRLAGLALMTQGYTAPALREAAERIAVLGGAAEGTRQLVSWARWVDACVSADFPTALNIAAETLDGAQNLHPAAVATGHQMLGTTFWHLGRTAESASHFDDALARLADLGPTDLTSPMLSNVVQTALTHSAANLAARGERAEGERRLARAVELAARTGPFAEAFARQSLAFFGMLVGDASHQAEAEWARLVIEQYDFRHLWAINRGIVGWHTAVVDDDPAGLEQMAAALELMPAVGMHMLAPAYNRHHGDALEHHGQIEAARDAYEAGLARAEQYGEHMMTADLLMRRGRVEDQLGGRGESWFVRAMELADEQGAHHFGELAGQHLAACPTVSPGATGRPAVATTHPAGHPSD